MSKDLDRLLAELSRVVVELDELAEGDDAARHDLETGAMS